MSNTPGIMIAAAKSGSGKTMITCALLQALKERKLTVSAFKCGPDYIDPMFHRKVIGIPSRNLDTFFSEEAQIRELFWRNRKADEISIIEGVMGLYDGLGGIRKEGSAYHLAQTLDIPVILVMDAHGMGRTLIPLLAGILQYDTDKRIAGVILNRTSKSFYETIAPVMESELSLPALGFFPKMEDFIFESRHLGLKLPGEIADLQQQVKRASEVLAEHVDIGRILNLAHLPGAGAENTDKNKGQGNLFRMPDGVEKPRSQKPEPEIARVSPVRIAVAQDEAFNFYYEDNLRMLREAGAELVAFSPLHDGSLPEGVSGILLGGGYPELFGKELSENGSMKKSIQSAIQSGMPSVAECGGFMYLHEKLVVEDGTEYPMAGVLPGTCSYKGKLVRFGYVEISEKKSFFLESQKNIKGHEFHYFDSTQNGSSCTAVKPISGKSWECVWETEDHWWGFPHLYYPSNPRFVSHFMEQCRNYQAGVHGKDGIS